MRFLVHADGGFKPGSDGIFLNAPWHAEKAAGLVHNHDIVVHMNNILPRAGVHAKQSMIGD